jgi:DNA primase
MPSWVNFKELRAKLNFEQVLQHYNVEIKRKGDQHHGYCPLPKHSGVRNSASFSANLSKGIFQCFGCGARGNLLEFAGLMEGINLEDGVAFREVALKLQNRFCPVNGTSATPPASRQAPVAQTTDNPTSQIRMVNPPLDFELKDLDPHHPYLLGRGFNLATIGHFHLGFCPKGLLKERLVIPLHDQAGRLIAYAGRLVDDKLVSEQNPRYRFPSKREHNGKTFEFRKTHFLYNGFRLEVPVHDLVIVEGFTAVWWLFQHDIRTVVALMGSDMSERQAQIVLDLVPANGTLWVMPDGDEAGERCAQSVFSTLGPHRFVRWAKLPHKRQPTDLTGPELVQLLTR